ncbi:MAG: hypothetical protein A3E81_01975 [Gammaproteobacteria bacterium RIFCSPHIGHO2_12_FULL_36_30]|nr:MAG: hypothetical protein A3E81_01975 [Gammaproteobacteria bacterium RIFCSPHIGHO2_12_FULL_36_30]
MKITKDDLKIIACITTVTATFVSIGFVINFLAPHDVNKLGIGNNTNFKNEAWTNCKPSYNYGPIGGTWAIIGESSPLDGNDAFLDNLANYNLTRLYAICHIMKEFCKPESFTKLHSFIAANVTNNATDLQEFLGNCVWLNTGAGIMFALSALIAVPAAILISFSFLQKLCERKEEVENLQNTLLALNNERRPLLSQKNLQNTLYNCWARLTACIARKDTEKSNIPVISYN